MYLWTKKGLELRIRTKFSLVEVCGVPNAVVQDVYVLFCTFETHVQPVTS